MNGVLTIRVRAHPLPALSATALDAHANTLRACFSQPPSAALDAELEENVAELHEQLAEGADAAKVRVSERFCAPKMRPVLGCRAA